MQKEKIEMELWNVISKHENEKSEEINITKSEKVDTVTSKEFDATKS